MKTVEMKHVKGMLEVLEMRKGVSLALMKLLCECQVSDENKGRGPITLLCSRGSKSRDGITARQKNIKDIFSAHA